MAVTGQRISNPLTGEEITFLRTAAETRGEELELGPGDVLIVPPGTPHSHRAGDHAALLKEFADEIRLVA